MKYIVPMVKAFAQKGRSLPRRLLEDLTVSSSLEDLVNTLRMTQYDAELSQVAKPYSADSIELALREHMIRYHYNIMISTSDRLGTELLYAYFRSHLSKNLKIVLRGKALGVSQDKMLGLINLFSEELIGRRNIVVEAMAARDLSEAVDLLKDSEFGEECTRALVDYEQNKNINVFDAYLDKAYYFQIAKAFSALRKRQKACQGIVILEFDAYNILTILRAKSWGLAPSTSNALLVHIAHGLGSEFLAGLISAESVSDGILLLKGTHYLDPNITASDDNDWIQRMERHFEKMIYQEASKPYLRNMKSLGTVLGSVKLIEMEVKNLAKIAYSIENRVPTDITLASLTFLT